MSQANSPEKVPAWRWFGRTDAHHRFFVSVGVAVIAFALMPGHLSWATRLLGSWNAFIYTTLGLMWTLIITAEPKEVVSSAKLEDSSRTAIFLLVLAGACGSVFAVVYELSMAKESGHGQVGLRVGFCILTVFASWFLVHSIYALRYAHFFYGTDENDKIRGGLDFPDEDEPDYLDFAYFSFVIGMCAQTSDVAVQSAGLRRLCLVHSVISFFFNVAIIGLSINTLSGLLQ